MHCRQWRHELVIQEPEGDKSKGQIHDAFDVNLLQQLRGAKRKGRRLVVVVITTAAAAAGPLLNGFNPRLKLALQTIVFVVAIVALAVASVGLGVGLFSLQLSQVRLPFKRFSRCNKKKEGYTQRRN